MVAVGVVRPVGVAILKGDGVAVSQVPVLTDTRVVYAVATVPLLPDAVSEWLLRLTPAGGFAVQQTAVQYPQVTAHYAPSAGYFPLPWWARLALLGAYAPTVMWIAAAWSHARCQSAP